jgi:hypothetical protein
MPRKPLRSQLNQIRAWVQEGRTDAWIAHQLEIPAAELQEFKRRHGLTAEGADAPGDVDLRDEIEAEIEAATREAEEAEDDEEIEAEAVEEQAAEDEPAEADEEARPEGERAEEAEGEGAGRRRRRRRRGGRGRGRGGRDREGQRNGARATVEGTFDHGEDEGFGLWLDPAVQDEPAYSEHWAGHRAVEVVIEPERIVIRRRDQG